MEPQSRADWQLPVRVFCGWVVASSIASGVAGALEAGFGLQKFGGLEYVPRILALETLRVTAPRLAAISACFASVAWAHRRGPGASAGTWRFRLWLPFAFVPIATPLAMVVALVASGGAMRVVFGLSSATFGAALLETASAADVAHGLLTAALHAVVLGALAAGAGTVLSRAKPRLGWKLVIVWTAAALIFPFSQVGIDAVWPHSSPLPDPRQLY